VIISAEEHFSQEDVVKIISIHQDDVELHEHKFLEMVYIINGKGYHTVNGEEKLVKKGDFFIINYGEYHGYKPIKNQPFDLINILFKPQLIDKSLKDCRRFSDLINHYLIRVNSASLSQNPTGVIYRDKSGDILDIILKMKEQYDKKELGYIELIRCYLIEIIINTIRKISTKKDGVSDVSNYIRAAVDENYMNQITLREISKKLNFSLPYLSKKFKNDTGQSFIGYLQCKRMEEAGRLLSNTEKKVGEIAELVGYFDIKFFTDVFKKHWGMTPRAFIKIYRFT